MVRASLPNEQPRTNAPFFAAFSTALLTVGPFLMLLLFAPATVAEPSAIPLVAVDGKASGLMQGGQAILSVPIRNAADGGATATSAVDHVVFRDPGADLSFCPLQTMPAGWSAALDGSGHLVATTGTDAIRSTAGVSFSPCVVFGADAARTVSLTVEAAGPDSAAVRSTTSGVVRIGDVFGVTPAGSLAFGPGVTATTALNLAFARAVPTTLSIDLGGATGLTVIQPSFPAGATSSTVVFRADETWRDDSRVVAATVSALGDATYGAFREAVQLTVTEAPAIVRVGTAAAQPVVLQESGAGATKSVQVRLSKPPTADVHIQVQTPGTEFTIASTSSLTVESDLTEQVFAIELVAKDDKVADGVTTTPLVLSVLPGSSDEYLGKQLTVSVQVASVGEEARILLPNSISVKESLSTSVMVRLDALPQGTVSLAVSFPTTSGLTVSPSAFTLSDADATRGTTVSITAVNDDVVGPPTQNVPFTVRVTGVSAGVVGYVVDKSAAVTLERQDDDAAGFTVSVSDGETALRENLGTDTVGIRLTGRPLSNVVLQVTGDATRFLVSPARVTFSPTDFNTLRTVTLTGVDNTVVAGIVASTLAISVVTSTTDTAAEFRQLPARQVAVRILDDDTGLLLSPGSLELAEGAAAKAYTIALSRQPAGDVTVTPGGGSQLTVSPASLAFTTANWATPQTVSVTAIDDLLVEAATAATITHVVTGNDAAFRAVAQTLAVTVLDNEVTITEADLQAYNEALQALVRVRKNPEGGNIIEFDMPPDPPGPVAGVQVFAANSPFVLVKTLDKDSAEFDQGRFVHTGLNARDSTRYIVTAYYGLSSTLGFAAGDTDPEDNIAGFTALGAGLASVDADGSVPTWVWLAVGALAFLLVLLLVVLLLRSRRRGPPVANESFGWDETAALPMSEPAATPAATFDEHAAAAAEPAAPASTEVHYCRCPACQTQFTVNGAKPIVTNCPGCGKKGYLR